MNTKTYAVINLTDIGLIDFAQVGESSAMTVRKSLDNAQFVIKWADGHTPTFITDSSIVPVQTYDHTGIRVLMASPEWTENIEVE